MTFFSILRRQWSNKEPEPTIDELQQEIHRAALETPNSGNLRAFGAQPRKLTPPAWRIEKRVFDGILIAGSLSFLIFAMIGAALHGHSVEEHRWGTRIKRACKFAPTIFPIFFAMVVGNLASVLAAWRMENGERLHIIEQLQKSTSLPRTITISYRLRRISFPALAFLLLWMLSPLGGQASLRFFDTESVSEIPDHYITYTLDNSTAVDETWNSSNGNQTGLDYLVQNLFDAAVFAPESVRNSSMDEAGNVKIPFLPRGAEDWVPVSSASNYQSSLLGVQVLDLPHGNTTFVINSTYFEFNCTKLDALENADKTRSDLYHDFDLGEDDENNCPIGSIIALGPTSVAANITALKYNATAALRTLPPRNVTGSVNNSILTGKYFEMFHFASQTNTTCKVKQVFVNAKVRCHGNSCVVEALRRSDIPDDDARRDSYAKLDNCIALSNFMVTVLDRIAPIPPGNLNYSLFEGYLLNPQSPLKEVIEDIPEHGGEPKKRNATTQNSQRVSEAVSKRAAALKRLPPSDVSVRFSQLFNTAWRASLIPQTIFGSIPASGFDKDLRKIRNEYSDRYVLRANVTDLQISVETYKCNPGWLFALILCSLALLASAGLGLYLGLQLMGPDILGYVSSLTRDNPNCPLAGDSSVMNGSERTRRLGDMKVQLRDVGGKDGEPYGHLPLTWVDERNEPGKRGFDHKKDYC